MEVGQNGNALNMADAQGILTRVVQMVNMALRAEAQNSNGKELVRPNRVVASRGEAAVPVGVALTT